MADIMYRHLPFTRKILKGSAVMKLTYRNHILEIENEVETVMDALHNLMSDKSYFSHIIVDGEEVYTDIEMYISENIHKIHKVELMTMPAIEFVNNLLLSAENYINQAIPEILDLSEEFYQNPTSESWERFNQMLEGVDWIHQVILSVDQDSNLQKPSNWMNYISHTVKMEAGLADLHEAVENKDYILVADIVRYELVEAFDLLGKEMRTTIDTEGRRNDVN